MSELDQIRENINSIDEQMAQLFQKRMEMSARVADFKKERGLSIRDAEREWELIDRNRRSIRDPAVAAYYVQFLRGILDLSCAYQSKLLNGMKVAYSGVKGAYGYLAARRMFPEAQLVAYPDYGAVLEQNLYLDRGVAARIEYLAAVHIDDVAHRSFSSSFAAAHRAVELGEADSVVLPLENSYAGEVGAVMDLLFSGELYINQVLDMEIDHSLLGVEGAAADTVRTVVSHPQALRQCDDYIRSHGYAAEPYSNTAAAAEYVRRANDPALAAIASEDAAEVFGLRVLERGINTMRTNTTRFAALSRIQNQPETTKKREDENFVLVFTVQNDAGSLAQTLNIIGAHGYNMRTLRSRPMKGLSWKYFFYVEAEGCINNTNGREMLQELSATCAKLRLVGAYYANNI